MGVPTRGPLRLVLDTNIVISGLLWRGAPRDLIKLVRMTDSVKLFTSLGMVEELRNTITRAKFATRLHSAGMSVDDLLFLYKSLAEQIEPARVERLVPQDSDDDVLVAAARGAKAHAIVSGDSDLTVLGSVAEVTILRVREAIALIKARMRPE